MADPTEVRTNTQVGAAFKVRVFAQHQNASLTLKDLLGFVKAAQEAGVPPAAQVLFLRNAGDHPSLPAYSLGVDHFAPDD